MTEVISQESLVLMAEEVISTLRSASEVTYIHNVKQYQDNIKSQYERFQFDAKHLLKTKSRELKALEEQASEPHVAAFEAKRAEFEELQQQLLDKIKELQTAITDHEASRKNACTELQQLKAREVELGNLRERAETRTQAYTDIFQSISAIDWDMDSDSISGCFWGVGSTREFNITPKPKENVVNTLWDMIDEEMGFEW